MFHLWIIEFGDGAIRSQVEATTMIVNAMMGRLHVRAPGMDHGVAPVNHPAGCRTLSKISFDSSLSRISRFQFNHK